MEKLAWNCCVSIAWCEWGERSPNRGWCAFSRRVRRLVGGSQWAATAVGGSCSWAAKHRPLTESAEQLISKHISWDPISILSGKHLKSAGLCFKSAERCILKSSNFEGLCDFLLLGEVINISREEARVIKNIIKNAWFLQVLVYQIFFMTPLSKTHLQNACHQYLQSRVCFQKDKAVKLFKRVLRPASWCSGSESQTLQRWSSG